MIAEILAAVSLLFPAQDTGIPNCAPQAQVEQRLGKRYAEKPTHFGVTNLGGLVELYQSEDKLTWTIVINFPNGISCLLAAGQGWRPRAHIRLTI